MQKHAILPLAAILSLLSPGMAAVAAVPPNATIPAQFTGVWAEQERNCDPAVREPTFTLTPGGFKGLPGEKAYPRIEKSDRSGRSIRVSFYNSNGALSWRSTEYFRLSEDGNRLEYRFAGGKLNWMRCSGPIADDRGPG
jgi:hypothetical protein